MISRVALGRNGIIKTVIEIISCVTNRKILKDVSIKYTNNLFRGYVTHSTKNIYNNTKILKSTNLYYSSETTKKIYEPELELNSVQFEKISTDTLESLTDYFDEIVEKAGHLQDADVSYGDGVLTVKFGKQEGTYVINRQTPNKQIWLSSPTSGPKRYDFLDGKWIYKHDGKTLHDLLNREIPAIVRNQTFFHKCSYSGKEQYLPSSTPD